MKVKAQTVKSQETIEQLKQKFEDQKAKSHAVLKVLEQRLEVLYVQDKITEPELKELEALIEQLKA